MDFTGADGHCALVVLTSGQMCKFLFCWRVDDVVLRKDEDLRRSESNHTFDTFHTDIDSVE